VVFRSQLAEAAALSTLTAGLVKQLNVKLFLPRMHADQTRIDRKIRQKLDFLDSSNNPKLLCYAILIHVSSAQIRGCFFRPIHRAGEVDTRDFIHLLPRHAGMIHKDLARTIFPLASSVHTDAGIHAEHVPPQ